MKKHCLVPLLILVLVLAFVAVGCGGGSTDKDTIAIGKTPYPNEWVPVHIIQHIAEELGYDTEIVEGEIGFAFLGVAQGDIDIYPDVWLPTLHKSYVDKYEDDIELTGTVYNNAAMGIAAPSYVDINSISELKGRGDEFGGRIVGIEPSAGLMLTTEDVMKAYELEDEYELLEGSTPAMLAEVERAIASEQPILFLAWRPHTMFVNYDMKLLEDTKGIWEFDSSLTAVAKDLKDKAPDLYEFTQKFEIPIDDIEGILAEMDETDKDVEVLAKEWIEKNRDKVDKMLGK